MGNSESTNQETLKRLQQYQQENPNTASENAHRYYSTTHINCMQSLHEPRATNHTSR